MLYQDGEFDITIIYKFNNLQKNKLRIFGSSFVNNNKDKCMMIYKNKISELKEFLDDEEEIKDNIISIKLRGINNIKDASSMFSGCNTLISLPDVSKWDTLNVNSMKYMFYECNSLLSLPDISKWNTCNIFFFDSMFYNCGSLISLPDISKWNTSNLINMSWMFNGCKSLISLPDISNWNTNNVKDIK